MPIVKQKRSPFYQVRRKVPEDLRVIVRKRELWRSLKTTDREVAKRRARKVEAEFDRVLDKARAQRSPKDINEVPEDTLIHLARKVYAEDLAKYADELLADPKRLSEGVWWIIDNIEDWLKGRPRRNYGADAAYRKGHLFPRQKSAAAAPKIRPARPPHDHHPEN